MSEFAGRLKSRVELWKRDGRRLETALPRGEWVMVTRCFAGVEAEGSGPILEGMALSAMQRFKVTVRKREEFAIDQRVHWQGRKLLIRQIFDDPNFPDRLTLRCEEVRS